MTYCDGINKKSKHNHTPSLAIDIAPYPIDWNDIGRFTQLSKIVLDIAKNINIEITWGGHFKTLKDYPHYEIKETT